MLLRYLTTLMICFGIFTQIASAQDLVAKLVYCFNSPPPEKNDSRLSPAALETIKKIFGYQYARIAQIASSPLDQRKSDFPPLGENFSLEIEQIGQKGDTYQLRVNFWHKDKSVVETVVDFKRGTPLFIKGPLYDKGLLVLIIQVNGDSSLHPKGKESL